MGGKRSLLANRRGGDAKEETVVSNEKSMSTSSTCTGHRQDHDIVDGILTQSFVEKHYNNAENNEEETSVSNEETAGPGG